MTLEPTTGSATSGVPIALTIAGSDPSGGAGIQADLKTFAAHGVYGASVITALTAQNTQGVTGVLEIDPDFIAAQIDAVASDLRLGAVKTGMLADRPQVAVVVSGIKRHGIKRDGLVPLVVDPVMVATSGDVLLAPDAIDAVRRNLIPLASVITPNLHEAARLLGQAVAASEAEMQRQGEALMALGAAAVVIKGGHATGTEAVDYLVTGEGTIRFAKPWVETRHTHGTGCTLAAAIAANLAMGRTLPDAVAAAKDYLWNALVAGKTLGVGQGRGPVDHAFALRRTGSIGAG